MKRLLPLISFLAITNLTFAQDRDQCTQSLRLAQSRYEEGHLREIDGLLSKCIAEHNFTDEQLVAAYRLLTLAHIYLEEPLEADAEMINLLKSDHFYSPNQAVDPAEFIALYNVFRTKPVFSVGLKVGPNATAPAVKSVYYVTGEGHGSYKPLANFQVGLTFEKAFTYSSEHKLLSRLSATPEIFYANSSFRYVNDELTTNQSTGEAQSTMDVTQNLSFINLNLITQYTLSSSNQLITYVGLGPVVNVLASASLQGQTINNSGIVVTGAAVDMKSTFEKINFSVMGLAGVKYKFGDIYVSADVRLQGGLLNAVNSDHRVNEEGLRDYGYIHNDFVLNNAMVDVGFMYPFFNPKKLKKK